MPFPFPSPYIGLDIETTGLDPDFCDIIEIAAVRVENGKITDTFDSLVYTDKHIPDIITHITGITEGEVRNATRFSEIQEKFKNFIGEFPVMGHNIQFDVNFLMKTGLAMKNPKLDTFHLASILIPENESLSLETLAKKLKIDHKNKHRALGDVQANIDLFNHLWEKLLEVDKTTLQKIIDVIKKSNWNLVPMFEEALLFESSKEKKLQETETGHLSPNHETDPLTTPYNLDDLVKENGPFAKFIPHYKERTEQRKIIEEIMHIIDEQKNLICEAPGGIGKTFAYLIPIILKKKQAVIATSTLHLQNQLQTGNFKILQKIFPEIKTDVLKGKNQYLCQERFENFIKKSDINETEAILIAKIFIWLDKTQTGDKSELKLLREELSIFDTWLTADTSCIKNENHECFLKKARKKAENADLLVINHALLFNETNKNKNIVPIKDVLIIDEAHRIENNLAYFSEQKFSFFYLHQLLNGLVYSLKSDFNFKNLENTANILVNTFATYEASWILFSREFLEKKYFIEKILIEKTFHERKDFKNMKDGTNKVLLQWETLKNHLQEKNTPIDIQIIADRLNDLFEVLNIFMNSDDITYIKVKNEEDISLHISSKNLETPFFDIQKKYQSTILISATLSDYGTPEKDKEHTSFHYIRHILNLKEDFHELLIPHTWPDSENFQVLVPEDLPSPRKVGNFKETSSIIFDIIRLLKGNILGLFTSQNSVESFYKDLAPIFKEQGIIILGQRISGSIGKITHAFFDKPDSSVLFGTKTFWEGIDFEPGILKALIIHRLPFDHPNDPVLKERMKIFKDSFNEYSVPRAIINFKQGVNRLIRSEKHQGKIFILDLRIIQSSYGKRFLEIFPEKNVKIISKNEIEKFQIWNIE